ncbi:acyl-CoA N-acyltransferase [Stachybotrys elegans]|uniref:Acyl-CoA N-acyltransferase n=1 Tax=Stachybotrys elegans TaxID=80388 RepID=A0A8K0SED5_9HYPO|nr:acyl-CoA N-acyltransferase [Stachybotrys elegans]
MTAGSLTFRTATVEDAPVIAALVKSAYRGESSRAGWTTEADYVADERIDAKGVSDKINDPAGVILMAYDKDGVLAACCELLKKSEKLGYFGLFAVDPQRQAGGLGRQVLAAAEAYAKNEMKVAGLEMQVIWLRDELISWYQRRGYNKTSETKPFPYEHLVNGKALRDDLYFTILYKDL